MSIRNGKKNVSKKKIVNASIYPKVTHVVSSFHGFFGQKLEKQNLECGWKKTMCIDFKVTSDSDASKH